MTAFGIYFTFSLFCTSERKTEVIVMFTSKPSSKIINFMSPGKGVLTKRWKKKKNTKQTKTNSVNVFEAKSYSFVYLYEVISYFPKNYFQYI